MNRGQSGQATLLGLLVIAMSSAVVSMQMRSLEQQSVEESLDRRADDARTYGMLGMARVQDLFSAGYLQKHCEDGRRLVLVNPELDRDTHRAVARIWDTSRQAAVFEYCDFEALSTSDRAALYQPYGEDPRHCKKVPVVVKVPSGGRCDKPLVAEATARVSKQEALLGDVRQAARLLVELDGPSTKKGCPFSCHMGPDGKNVRSRAAP